MRIRVVLFAAAREILGRNDLEIELPEGSTIADLRTGIADLAPEVATLLSNSLFSVDLEYANENDLLREDQEVAMIPPVSGG